jgi:hypothetical protein
MKPLDIIPELVGAKYTATASAVVIYKGHLYITSLRGMDRTSIIALVKQHGVNLHVHSIQRSGHTLLHRNKHECVYMISYVVVDPNRAESCCRLRVVK